MNDRLFLLGILLSFFCFSCGKQGKEESEVSKNILENLAVTFDTVGVDMGEEVLMAGAYENFALSPDASRIFFEYGENTEIHEIDLYQMRLVKRHALADDGPDRAPSYVKGFQLVPEYQFFMFSSVIAGIYDLNGKKVEAITNRLSEIPGLESLREITFITHAWISPDRSKLMVIPYKHGEWLLKLAVIDLAAKTGKVYSLPALDVTQDYQVNWEEDGMLYSAGDMIESYWINDQLAIASSSTADFYLFDWKSDSLRLIENEPRVLPNMKKGTVPVVASMDEWTEVSKKLGKMVNYKELLFDSSRQLYFRLATQNANYNADHKRLGEEVWLLSYDLNFKLTGEKQIKEITWAPWNPFFKDGALFGYAVVDEDPAFGIMDLQF